MRAIGLLLSALAFMGLGIGLATMPRAAMADTAMRLSIPDIDASPEAVFALVDEPRLWSRWMPYQKDVIRRTFSGPAKGKGAVYEWEGAGAAGSGRAQIIESSTPGKVVVDVDLRAPVAGHLTWVFTIDRPFSHTQVDVKTSGPVLLVMRATDMFFAGRLGRLGCVAGGEPYHGRCEEIMHSGPIRM